MISYKTYKLLNEHFGPMALGVKAAPTVGISGSVMPPEDDMAGDLGDDMAGGDDLESLGGEEGAEDMAMDGLDDDFGDGEGGSGNHIHHHHHYHITMPNTDKDGDGKPDMNFSPFDPGKQGDMMSLAGLGGDEEGGDDMGGEEGGMSLGGDAEGDDLGGDMGDEEGSGNPFGGDEGGSDDADSDGVSDDEDSDGGLGLDDDGDDDMGDDDSDDSDDDEGAGNPFGGKSKSSSDSKPKSKPKSDSKPKKEKKDDSGSDDKKEESFMRSFLNNAKGHVYRNHKIKFAEDAVVAPADPNVGLADAKPGNVGYAPQGRIGGEQKVKNDYFGYTSIEDMTVAEYREWKKQHGKKINENKKTKK